MLAINRFWVDYPSAAQINHVRFIGRIEMTLSNTNIYQALSEYTVIFAALILKAKKLPEVILSDKE